jgi:hypothetical protein
MRQRNGKNSPPRVGNVALSLNRNVTGAGGTQVRLRAAGAALGRRRGPALERLVALDGSPETRVARGAIWAAEMEQGSLKRLKPTRPMAEKGGLACFHASSYS